MAGYHNYSMSNNAVAAYAHGEKPLSKWRKSDILEAAAEYLQGQDAAAQKLAWLRSMPLSLLKLRALTRSSWHHTSKQYNKTDFYSLDEYFLDEMTEEDTQGDNESEPAPQPTRRQGAIQYLVWGGTRKHPKAYERELAGVFIEEKGSFFLVYDQSDNLILRKKIGSNGTFVKYN